MEGAVGGVPHKAIPRAIGAEGERPGRSHGGFFSLAAEVGLGLLLGRASLLGAVFPFGPAFFAALRATPGVPSHPVVVGAAVAVGTLTLGMPGRALHVALSLFVTELALGFLHRRGRVGPVMMALATATAVAAVGGAEAVWSRQARELVLLPFEAVLAALLSGVFYYGMGPLLALPKVKAPSSEEILCTGVLLGAAVAGLVRIGAGGLALQNIVGALLVMTLGLIGGAPLGAAVGATYGVVSRISSAVSPTLVGGYAFAGLLAGIFHDFGKPGAALGFVIGQVMVTYSAASYATLRSVVEEAAVAAGLLMAVPRRWLQALGGALGGTGGLSLVGGGQFTPEAALRDLASRRLEELARVFTELARAFEQVAPSAEPAEQGGGEAEGSVSLYGALAERVCDHCERHGRCWEQEFHRTYRSLRNLWKYAERRGRVTQQDLGQELRRRCVRPRELVLAVNLFHDLFRVNRYWGRRVLEGREVVGTQLRGVSQVVEGLASDVRERFPQVADSPMLQRRPQLECRVGLSRATKHASLVSGDSHLIRPLEAGKLLVAISDGMGAGPRAAMESKATITLLERLLETGFTTQLAVQTINSILLLRSPEDSFATLDLVIVDLCSGAAEFIKIGAAPSFLLRRGQVMPIKAPSLPVGILNHVEMQSIRRVLSPQDVLVLASDGLFQRQRDPTEGEAWVAGFLAGLTDFEPQVISGALLVKALDGSQQGVSDDVTIIVLSLQSAREGRKARIGPVGWAVARWERQK